MICNSNVCNIYFSICMPTLWRCNALYWQPIFSLCLKYFSLSILTRFFQKYYFMKKKSRICQMLFVYEWWQHRVWNNYIEQNKDNSISQNPFVKWPASKMRKIFSLVIHVFSRLSFGPDDPKLLLLLHFNLSK